MNIKHILCTIVLCLCALSGFAAEPEKENIDKSAILAILEKGEIVDGFMINADDLEDIIRETDITIRVNGSVIQGGLDFETIRTVTNEIDITDSDIMPSQNGPDETTGFSVNARRTVFSKSVDFFSTRFHGEADFEAAVFLDTLYLQSAEFFGDALFNSARFESDAHFNSAKFNGKAGFGAVGFQGEAEFYSTEFAGPADFGSVRFACNAVFGTAWFSETGSGVTFNSVGFEKDADFESAQFGGPADFRFSRFAGDTFFEKTRFQEGGTFKTAQFDGMAYFQWSEFNGDADFNSVRFQLGADFNSAKCDGAMSLDAARFVKTVFFKNASFDTLIFGFTKFEEYADVRNVEIKKLIFEFDTPSIVKSRMDFRNAKITDARFVDVIFEKDVDFSDAEFGANYEKFRHFMGPPRPPAMFEREKESTAVFRYVTFETDAYFVRTKFSCDTIFEMINFKKNANFNKANFEGVYGIPHRFSFSYINYGGIILRWNQFPDIVNWVRRPDAKVKMLADQLRRLKFLPERHADEIERIWEELEIAKIEAEKIEPLSEALRNLEANFRKQKLLDDANLAYFHMKDAELEEIRTDPDVEWWRRIQWELERVFWGISCGYGTRIWRIVGWIIFFQLIFTLIFFTHAGLFSLPEKESLELKGKGIFDFPNFYMMDETGEKAYKKADTLKMAHRFSTVVLFKFGKKNIVISGKIWGIHSKYFVWTAWILGFYLIFCFGVTLSNTFPLINRLIEGVF